MSQWLVKKNKTIASWLSFFFYSFLCYNLFYGFMVREQLISLIYLELSGNLGNFRPLICSDREPGEVEVNSGKKRNESQ